MNYIDTILEEIMARLPELEWKISSFGGLIQAHNLPRGLFQLGSDCTAKTCIENIKADIRILSHQKSHTSAFYLANKIKEKINVLVTLCQIESRKDKKEPSVNFGISMLSTRQQWIASIEHDIKTLEIQQQAMRKRLTALELGSDIGITLSLQVELGMLEKRLTLARETLNKAIN